MIFVTVGTQKFQFNRLLIELDRLCEIGVIDTQVVAQSGYSTYQPNNFKIYKLISQDLMNKFIGDSDIVITHGGTSSIFNALKLRKKVIVVPRLQEFGEHVDNHQNEICEILEKQGYVSVAWKIDSLQDLIKKVKENDYKTYESYSESLVEDIQLYIKENNKI